jgi:hypothetical protein
LCAECHESEQDALKQECGYLDRLVRENLFAGDVNTLLIALHEGFQRERPDVLIDALEALMRYPGGVEWLVEWRREQLRLRTGSVA